jgi:hypothetical protein
MIQSHGDESSRNRREMPGDQEIDGRAATRHHHLSDVQVSNVGCHDVAFEPTAERKATKRNCTKFCVKRCGTAILAVVFHGLEARATKLCTVPQRCFRNRNYFEPTSKSAVFSPGWTSNLSVVAEL